MTCTGAICPRCAGWPTCCPGSKGSTSWSSSGCGRPSRGGPGPAGTDRLGPAGDRGPARSAERRGATGLVRETLPEADDAFCAACHEETGGNPLLLHELSTRSPPRAWPRPRSTCPAFASSGRGPARAPSRCASRASRRRRRRSRGRSRSWATTSMPGRRPRSPSLGDEAASEAAVALARVDILRAQPPFGFVHPLIRAAVYEALTPAERDSGHARAARLLEAAGAEPERVAAHLLRAPGSGDPRVVAVLRRGRSPGALARRPRERRRIPAPCARRAAPRGGAGRAAARARLRRGARERRRRDRAPAARRTRSSTTRSTEPSARSCSATSASSSLAATSRTPA